MHQLYQNENPSTLNCTKWEPEVVNFQALNLAPQLGSWVGILPGVQRQYWCPICSFGLSTSKSHESCRRCHRLEYRPCSDRGDSQEGQYQESIVGIHHCMLHQCCSPFRSFGHSTCIHLNKSRHRCHRWDDRWQDKYWNTWVSRDFRTCAEAGVCG